jgi:hypothetical protein
MRSPSNVPVHPDMETIPVSLGISAAQRSASSVDSANRDSDNEHQKGSYGQGLPPGKAMPPQKRLMEEQNQSGESAYCSAYERNDYREGRDSIVNLRSQSSA